MFIEIKDGEHETLLIRKQPNGEVIAEHQISADKGKLIKKRNHTRDRSKGIEEFKQRVISSFEEQETARAYVNEICLRYTRYRRDQLTILQTVIKNDLEWINQALQKCLSEKLYSANDFRDVVSYFKKVNIESVRIVKESTKDRPAKTKIDVTTRSLSAYTRILGGRAQ